MALALAFTACSDEYMNDMNTDPSKAENIDPNSQLTFFCRTTDIRRPWNDRDIPKLYRCLYAAAYGMLEYNKLRRSAQN